MAFLDKLGSLAKNAADKTNEMMETSKLNSKINESKSKIAARKSEIGEYYWKKYESGETLHEEVMELCAAIKAEDEAIEGYNQEIMKIKAAPPQTQEGVPVVDLDATPCASCGAPVPAGKKFCPECGTPATLPQPAPAPDSVACPSCGKPIPEGKSFCPECGAPAAAQ